MKEPTRKIVRKKSPPAADAPALDDVAVELMGTGVGRVRDAAWDFGDPAAPVRFGTPDRPGTLVVTFDVLPTFDRVDLQQMVSMLRFFKESGKVVFLATEPEGDEP
jgi:hypothetical protein